MPARRPAARGCRRLAPSASRTPTPSGSRHLLPARPEWSDLPTRSQPHHQGLTILVPGPGRRVDHIDHGVLDLLAHSGHLALVDHSARSDPRRPVRRAAVRIAIDQTVGLRCWRRVPRGGPRWPCRGHPEDAVLMGRSIAMHQGIDGERRNTSPHPRGQRIARRAGCPGVECGAPRATLDRPARLPSLRRPGGFGMAECS